MVHEDGGANVAYCRKASVGGYKAKSRANELTHADDLAWGVSLVNVSYITKDLMSP